MFQRFFNRSRIVDPPVPPLSQRTYSLSEMIRILPMPTDYRDELLTFLPRYSQKTVEDLSKKILDVMQQFTQDLTQAEYDVFMLEVQQGKRNLSKHIRQDAWQTIAQELNYLLDGIKKIDEVIAPLITRIRHASMAQIESDIKAQLNTVKRPAMYRSGPDGLVTSIGSWGEDTPHEE